MRKMSGIMISKTKAMKSTFEDWFHTQEFFSLRSTRFFNECELYLKDDDQTLKNEGEAVLISWLKQAFEAGKNEKEKSI